MCEPTPAQVAAWKLLSTDWLPTIAPADMPVALYMIEQGYVGSNEMTQSEIPAIASRLGLSDKRIRDILTKLRLAGIVSKRGRGRLSSFTINATGDRNQRNPEPAND